MESRSYNFSTARKRSSQLASSVIKFPREDDTAPRMRILAQECPDSYQSFKACMVQTGNNATQCDNFKQELNACGVVAFRKANSDASFRY